MQRKSWFAAAAMALVAAPAFAQQKPASPKAGAAKPGVAVEGVTVRGAPPPVRTSIDRKSYSVAGDLQATTGSISDALRNIPSVEVDVQGNVSLRGDQNVTILIDGKPSGLFRGEGKAQALQSLPADRVERVEVITNPSAAFNPDGTAGIINLVTRKTARPGTTGSLRLNLGSGGRQNGGLSASRKDGRFTVSGDLYGRHDSYTQSSTSNRSFAAAGSGAFANTERASHGSGSIDLRSFRGEVDFDPDAKTRFGLEVDYTGLNFDGRIYDTLDETAPGGAPRLAYDRINALRQDRDNLETTFSFRRKVGDDHELTVTLTRELIDEDRSRPALTRFRVPPDAAVYEDAEYRNHFWRTQLKADDSIPLPGSVKVKSGYEFDDDDNDYNLIFGRGPASGPVAIDANLSNLFKFDRQIHAAYATYERPIGKFTALAGLRIEATRIDLNQVTARLKSSSDYVRLYPSLHMSYQLDETRQLSASYSRRVQRPEPQDYNPFVTFLDPQNLRSGNPRLKPQQTDSFELGYQYRKRGATYLATAYYRNGRDAVNDVVRDIGDGVFLTTRANIGRFQTAGLELVANGRLPGRLSYNVSGNALWSEIDGTGLGFGSGRRSAYLVSGRGSLSWQATPKDMVQAQGSLIGKRLTPQGFTEPVGVLNLGYRHKFREGFSGVVTVQDALDSFHIRNVIDTPTLKEVVRGAPRNQGVFVGFTYAFGGGRQRDPGFDFGGGGPPS